MHLRVKKNIQKACFILISDFNPPPANAQSGPNMKQWLQGGVWPHSQSKGSGQDDKQSTLSRYWTMDRSLQRRLQKTNYQHIKRICRDRGQLFEDTDFQPNNRSIYKHKKPPLHPITWLRPHVRSVFTYSIRYLTLT